MSDSDSFRVKVRNMCQKSWKNATGCTHFVALMLLLKAFIGNMVQICVIIWKTWLSSFNPCVIYWNRPMRSENMPRNVAEGMKSPFYVHVGDFVKVTSLRAPVAHAILAQKIQFIHRSTAKRQHFNICQACPYLFFSLGAYSGVFGKISLNNLFYSN